MSSKFHEICMEIGTGIIAVVTMALLGLIVFVAIVALARTAHIQIEKLWTRRLPKRAPQREDWLEDAN